MKFLLDTNTVVSMLRSHPEVLRRLRLHQPADIGVPAIVAHELYFGAFESGRPDEGAEIVDALEFDILEFECDDARRAGEVRAGLAAAGTPIGPYDVLIAGQALARDLILVTHNLREFQRVPGLKVEDWEAL